MLQMADARTSGTAVTRIFSVLEVNGRDEEKAFAYLKKLRAERAALHQERRRRHAAGRPGPGGRRHLLHRRCARHQGQGLRRRRSASPRKASARRPRRSRSIKGAKNADAGKKLIDWATSPAMQRLFAKHKINFVPAHPDVKTEASARRGAEGRENLRHRRRLRRRQPQAHRRPLGRRDPAVSGRARGRERRHHGRRASRRRRLPTRRSRSRVVGAVAAARPVRHLSAG